MKTKKTAKKKTKRTAKQLVKDIVRVLNCGYTVSDNKRKDAAHLWNLLTALRGPDNNDHFLKIRSTTRLRGALGLDWKFNEAIVTHEPVQKLEKTRENFVSDEDHFVEHFNAAIKALEYFGLLPKPEVTNQYQSTTK